MNVIGNLTEFINSYALHKTQKPLKDIIEEIKAIYPDNVISLEYKDGGYLLFEFQMRTQGGTCVFDYTGTAS